MKIYKLSSYGDSDFPDIKYGTSGLVFEKQIQEWENSGYGIADDTIEEISFNSLEELCNELNRPDRKKKKIK